MDTRVNLQLVFPKMWEVTETNPVVDAMFASCTLRNRGEHLHVCYFSGGRIVVERDVDSNMENDEISTHGVPLAVRVRRASRDDISFLYLLNVDNLTAWIMIGMRS